MSKNINNENFNSREILRLPSEEQIWLGEYPQHILNRPALTGKVCETIYSQNKDRMSQTALINFDHKITYAKQEQLQKEAAKALTHIGVKKGDVVTFIGLNTTRMITYILAANDIGAVVNPLSPGYDEENVLRCLKKTESNKIVMLDLLYQKYSNILNDPRFDVIFDSPIDSMNPIKIKLAPLAPEKNAQLKKLRVDLPNFDRFHRMSQMKGYAKCCNYDPTASYERGALRFLFQSTGSTGPSKPIMHTDDSVLSIVNMHIGTLLNNQEKDLALTNIPFPHTTGLISSIVMLESLGIPIVLETMFDNKNFGPNIEKYDPSITVGPPTHFEALEDSSEFAKAKLNRAKYFICGGEPLAINFQERCNNNFAKNGRPDLKLGNGYGQSEHPLIAMTAFGKKYKPGSVGIPGPKTKVKIIDPTTKQEVTYNKRGILCAKSDGLMLGYYKDIDATIEYFDKDGYGITGDIGYIDEDGYIFVLGRANDSFVNANGNRIYLFDIRNALLEHSAVNLCEVSVINCNGKDEIFVDVVLNKDCRGFEKEFLSELATHCKTTLSQEQMSFAFRFRDEFLQSASGKRDKDIIKKDKRKYYRQDDNNVIWDVCFIQNSEDYQDCMELHINNGTVVEYEAKSALEKEKVLEKK